MAISKLDTRQSVHRPSLSFLTGAASTQQDTININLNSQVAKLYEDRNFILDSRGTVNFTAAGTTVIFSSNLMLHINSLVAGGAPTIIDLGSTSRVLTANGRMIYAVINRTLGTAVVTDDSTTLPAVTFANQEVVLIAKRIDATDGTKRVYFRNGFTLSAGQTARFGQGGTVFANEFQIADATDTTKLIQFTASGNTSGRTLFLAGNQTTSQILNVPNITATDTIATLGLTQTFTGVNTFGASGTALIVSNTALINGALAIGATDTTAAIGISSSSATGTIQRAININYTASATATALITGTRSLLTTGAAVSVADNFRSAAPLLTGGGITRFIGFDERGSSTHQGTHNASFADNELFTGNWFINQSGIDPNLLTGNVNVASLSSAFTGATVTLFSGPTFTNPTVASRAVMTGMTSVATTGTNANVLEGGMFTNFIGAANTQNWTANTPGLTAVRADPRIASGATGTVSNFLGFFSQFLNSASGATCTNSYGVLLGATTATGTVTNNIGFASNIGTVGTNNVDVLLGTLTAPVGNYGIYQSNATQNQFGGNVLTAGYFKPTANTAFTSGTFQKIANDGIVLSGATGSTYDLALAAVAGQEVLVIPTGTSNVTLRAGGADALIINSSQQVGIGVTPSAPLHIKPTNISGLQEGLRLEDAGAGSGEGLYIRWDSASKTDQARIGQDSQTTGSDLVFYTNSANSGTPTEAFRLFASGLAGFKNGTNWLQITTPSNPAANNNKLYFKSDNHLYSLTSAGVETQVDATNTPTSSSFELINLGVALTTVTNDLRINLKQADGSTDPSTGTGAVKVGFRTVNSDPYASGAGGYVERSVTAALSIQIPANATLGIIDTSASSQPYIWLYALDNAGTVELAVSSTRYNEGTLQSTTALTNASDSASVIYSTVARSNVSVRLLARLKVNGNQVAGGTWNAAVTETLLMLTSNDFSDVQLSYRTTAGGQTINAGVDITFGTRLFDSHGAFNGTTFTAPIAGTYLINANIDFATFTATGVGNSSVLATAGTNTILLDRFIFQQTTTAITHVLNGTLLLKMQQGDTLSVQMSNIASLTTASGAANTYINITRKGDV